MGTDSVTPFFIPFRDQITYCRQLVKWLLDHDVPPEVIYFVDNETTYPEAKDQLSAWARDGMQVLTMGRNTGAWGVFHGPVQEHVGPGRRYYVSDPDMAPDPVCPDDLLPYLHGLLDKYDYLGKIGLCLRIDDIPDCFPHKQHVIHHESRYWKHDRGDNAEMYSAPIATTFALYRSIEATPGGDPRQPDLESARTRPPYIGKHLAWYFDPATMPEDVRYYFQHCPYRYAPKEPGSSWKPDLPHHR